MNHSLEAYDGTFSFWYNTSQRDGTPTTTTSGTFTLTKNASVPIVVQSGSNYIFGPFQFNCSKNANYQCLATDIYGNNISTAVVCNSAGTGISLSGHGDKTFYVSIPMTSCSNGVASIVLKATKRVTITTKTPKLYKAAYYYSDGAQPVQSQEFTGKTDTETTHEDRTKQISWTTFNGGMIIYKEKDSLIDPYQRELANTTFILQNINGQYIQFRNPAGAVYSSITGSINNISSIATTTDVTAATQLITDSSGYVGFCNISPNWYRVIERSCPYYGYTSMLSTNWQCISSGTGINLQFDNPWEVGNLLIHKVDKDTQKSLPNVSFKIKNNAGQYVVAYDSAGEKKLKVQGSIDLSKMEFDNTGTTFTTNANGDIKINYMLTGDYNIIETENPNYGYDLDSTPHPVTITKSVTKENIIQSKVDNEKQTGNLIINKKDMDSNTVMAGVSFKVKALTGDHAGQYIIPHDGQQKLNVTGDIVLTDISYTPNKNSATTFTTDANGHIGIYNLLTDTYEVEEISVGSNDEYEIDNNYIKWETSNNTSGDGSIGSIVVKRQSSQNTETSQLASTYADTITYKNRRKYTKLLGYVWEDAPDTKDTDSNKRDSVYTAGSTDKLVQGIPVVLRKKSDGGIANTYNKDNKQLQQGGGSTLTNAQGAYDFTYVLINDIPDLYIEFGYNGMGYDNVDVKIDLQSANPENGNVQNGNKASEGTLRAEFNKKYQTITYNSDKGTIQNGTGQAKNENTNTYLLQYDSANGESKLVYGGNKALYNYGYSGNESSRIPFTGVYDQYMITATTYNAYGGCLDKIRTPAQIRSGNVEELKNLNLGLKKRLEADLSIIKDIDSAKVHINGQDHIYRYSDRFNTNLYYDEQGNNGYNMSPATKFGQTSRYGTMTYTRALYASDIFYGVGDVYGKDGDVLDVKITYKIGISNKSNLYGVVNEVIDYYDTKYSEIKIGTEVEKNGMIKAGTELSGTKETSENSQYTKIRINTQKLEIKPYEQRFIYIVLTVNPTHIIDILGRTEQEIKLDNVLEITSYSMKDANQSPYAAIDKNSQPGNMNINDNSSNKTTFEDDTDKAPGMKLVLQEKRQITGTVFVDNPVGDEVKTAKLMSGEIRQGDGIYNSATDKGLENVIVTLKNSKGNIAQVYNQTDGLVNAAGIPLSVENTKNKWADAIVKTNRNGEFTIEGLIPDDYTIVYTWGDKEHKVQNYKATIVEEKSYNAKGNKENQNIEWYKDEFKKRI